MNNTETNNNSNNPTPEASLINLVNAARLAKLTFDEHLFVDKCALVINDFIKNNSPNAKPEQEEKKKV